MAINLAYSHGIPESDITTSRIVLSGDPVHTLNIATLPKYNQTVVECVAHFADGSPVQMSDPAMLIVSDHSHGSFITMS